jgi:hypothetical protein
MMNCSLHNNFAVEPIQSLQYQGTGGVVMMHLVLKFSQTKNQAKPPPTSIRNLLNFPHYRFKLIRGIPDWELTGEYPIIPKTSVAAKNLP